MGGARVFPGGAVDAADSTPGLERLMRWSGDPSELPWRAAALRELAEEAGILVMVSGATPAPSSPFAVYDHLRATNAVFDADALEYLSNWVTPRGLPQRFDARFYVVEVPAGVSARSDRSEVYDPVWVAPSEAVAAADRGDWQVEMPTRFHLELLNSAPDLDAALAAARAAIPVPIEPRLLRDPDGAWRVLLPDDPGFEWAGL